MLYENFRKCAFFRSDAARRDYARQPAWKASFWWMVDNVPGEPGCSQPMGPALQPACYSSFSGLC